MRNEQVEAVIARLGKVCKAVLVGGLLVAVLQGIVGGAGMALMGLPGLFWGTMMGFASLIPVVGTGLIVITSYSIHYTKLYETPARRRLPSPRTAEKPM